MGSDGFRPPPPGCLLCVHTANRMTGLVSFRQNYKAVVCCGGDCKGGWSSQGEGGKIKKVASLRGILISLSEHGKRTAK